MLLDASTSIRNLGLIPTLIQKCTEFEEAQLEFSRNRVSRRIFHTAATELDGREFVSAQEIVEKRPFGHHYRTGRGTYLDKFVCEESYALLTRFDKDDSSETVHVLAVMTDGENRGPDYSSRIKTAMGEICKRAKACGGFAQSRIVVWYIGVGLTKEEHLRTARDRYGIPECWIKWVPATTDGVTEAGDALVCQTRILSGGGETRWQ